MRGKQSDVAAKFMHEHADGSGILVLFIYAPDRQEAISHHVREV